MLGKVMWCNIISSDESAGNTRGKYHLYCISEFHVTKSEAKVADRLGLSYSNGNELNAIIDSDLLGQPPFQWKEVIIGNECLEFHSRDIIECM
jgi:hypothetical protein